MARGSRRRPLDGAPRGNVPSALLVAGLGLALGDAWWGFAATLPVLYVPLCAAMMAMCMKGHGASGQTSGGKPDPVSSVTGASAIGDAGPC